MHNRKDMKDFNIPYGMKYLFFCFSLCAFLLNFNFASAQVPVASSSESKMQSFIVANVDIYNARIIEQNLHNDRNFSLGFSLENLSGIQPAVKYAVQLSKIVNKKEENVDEKIYDETFPLPEKQLVSKIISYTIPDALSAGTYKLYIESRNESGLILGFAYAGEAQVKSDGPNSVYIDVKSCVVTTGASTEKVSSQISIESSDAFSIKCGIINTLGQVTLIPNIKTNEGSIFGRIASSSEVLNSDISLKKGSGTFSATLPKPIKPGYYAATVFLSSPDGFFKTNTVSFEYLSAGITGNIENIIFDKSSYQSGDTAKVKIFANYFGVLSTTSIEVRIANSSGNICADVIMKELNAQIPITEIEIPINRNCDGAQADITLYYINKDGQKVILDSRSVSTSLPKNNLPFNFGKLLVVLLIIMLVAIIIWWMKIKKNTLGSIFRVMLLVIAISISFFPANKSEAATYNFSHNSDCPSTGCAIYNVYNLSVNDSTFGGSSITASWQAKGWGFKNGYADFGKIKSGGVTNIAIDGSIGGSPSSVAQYDNGSWVQGGPFGGGFYSSTLVAPNTLGTHNITARINYDYKIYAIDQALIEYSASSDAVAGAFTVIVPPTATITGSPSIINAGASSTITWNTTDLNMCTTTQSDASGFSSVIGNNLNMPDTTYIDSRWNYCSGEDGTCSFTGIKDVRYGANGSYAYGNFANGVGCNNNVFGDPAQGTGKQCYYYQSNPFISDFGNTVTGGFNSPSGLARDSAGNIYVADHDNNMVQKFSSTGAYIFQLGGFNHPYGLAVDSSNNLYVADAGNNLVKEYNSTGALIATINNYSGIYLSRPSGIAFGVDPLYAKPTMYVANAGGNNLIEYILNNGNWTYVRKVSGLNNPFAVVADNVNNYVYVLDTGNNRIVQYDSYLGYYNAYGSGGAAAGQFNSPEGVTLDTTNHVLYVTEAGNSRIQKIQITYGTYNRPTLAYASQFGSLGSTNGLFNQPWGIAYDGSGNLYITDRYNSRVQKMSVGGSFDSKFGFFAKFLNQPYALTKDSAGNTLVIDSGDNLIEKYDSSNVIIMKFGSYGTGDGQWNNPRGIDIDASGNIYVADTLNNRIEKFSATGTYQSKWSTAGQPWGIVHDTLGNFYVVNSNMHTVQKFTSTGSLVTTFGTSGTLGTSGTIGSGASQFYGPRGMTIDSSNNIYIADTGNNRISKFNSNGVPVTSFGGSNSFGTYGAGNGQFNWTADVALDSSGNIYVTDTNNHRIQKFTSNGIYISQTGTFGRGRGTFYNPEGIIIDSNDNILVADRVNSVIQKLSLFVPQGVDSGTLTKNTTFTLDCAWIDPNSTNSTAISNSTTVYIQPTATTTASSSIVLYQSSSTIYWNSTNATQCKMATTSSPTAPSTYNNIVATVDSSFGVYQRGLSVNALLNPQGMTTDKEGNVYVTDTTNRTIKKYASSTGNLILLTIGSGANLNAPIGVAVDATGTIYVLDSGFKSIVRFNGLTGGFISSTSISGVNNFSSGAVSTGIAIDSRGDILVVDNTDQIVNVLTSAGVWKWSIGTHSEYWGWPFYSWQTIKDLASPQKVVAAIDPNGDEYIYVTTGANRVIKFWDTTNGAVIRAYGPGGGTYNGQLNNPSGISIAKDGSMYIVDQTNQRIQKWDKDGNYVSQFGRNGAGNGQFYNPTDISIDPQGNFYVLDSNNGRFQKFSDGYVLNNINDQNTYVWVQCNNTGMATTSPASTTIKAVTGAYADLVPNAAQLPVVYNTSLSMNITTRKEDSCTLSRNGTVVGFVPVNSATSTTYTLATSTLIQQDSTLVLSCMNPLIGPASATTSTKYVTVKPTIMADPIPCILGTWDGVNSCASQITWQSGTTTNVWIKGGDLATPFCFAQGSLPGSSAFTEIATSTPYTVTLYHSTSSTGLCASQEPSASMFMASTSVYGVPVISNLSVSSSTIAQGSSTILTSSSANAASCTVSAVPTTGWTGSWSGAKATTSTTTTITNIQNTTTFTFKCTNTATGAPYTASTTISKTVTVIPPPSLILHATSPVNAYTGTSVIDWQTTNANTCTTTAAGVKISNATNTAGINLSNLSTSTTIALYCQNIFGVQSPYSVLITVTPASPIGTHVAASCNTISGWACDLDNTALPIDVHFYRDGAAGAGGTIIGTMTANLSNSTAAASCGGNAIHGFSFPTPVSVKDGLAHTIYVHGINIPSGQAGASNNLISGTPISVTCPLVSITTFSALPNPVDYASSTTLTWGTTGASTCVASSSPSTTQWDANNTLIGTSGSKKITGITATTTYGITCYSSYNTQDYKQQIVTIKPPTVQISSTPVSSAASPLANGATANITWSSTNAQSCSVTESGTPAWTKTATSGTNVISDALKVNTTFTVTCTNPGGSDTKSTTVYVGSTADISAAAYQVPYGSSVNILWVANNVTTCTTTKTIYGGSPTDFPPHTANSAGTNSGSLTSTTTFNFSCTKVNGGTINAPIAAVITVLPQPSASLSASLTSINAGNSTMLSWSSTSTNAATCNLFGTSTSGVKTNPAANQNASGTKSVSPTETTDYQMSCTGNNGSPVLSNVVHIAVTQVPVNLTAIITASSTSVNIGSSTGISWTEQNMTSCTTTKKTNAGESFVSNVLNQATTSTGALSTTTTYIYSCDGQYGKASSTWQITVSATPSAHVTAASPVGYDDLTRINLTSSNVTTCTTTFATTSGTKTLSNATNTTALTDPQERILATTTITMSCTGPYGPASDTKTIYITGNKYISITSSCSLENPPAYLGQSTIWRIDYIQNPLHTLITAGPFTYLVNWFGANIGNPYTVSSSATFATIADLTRKLTMTYTSEGTKTMNANTTFVSHGLTYYSTCATSTYAVPPDF